MAIVIVPRMGESLQGARTTQWHCMGPPEAHSERRRSREGAPAVSLSSHGCCNRYSLRADTLWAAGDLKLAAPRATGLLR